MHLYITKRSFCTLFTSALIVFAACSAPRQLPGNDVSFAVMGNTSPASPFTGYPEKLEQVFACINRDNPMLVIHTGNVIQGGPGNVGIKPGDITRQFRKFLDQKKTLAPILHVLAGERDIYDGSLDLFRQFTGEKLYYSFNYGTVHFIMLHVLNRDHRLDAAQTKWLERDLDTHRYDAAIFVFTHHPVLSSPYSGIRYQDGARLHELFKNFPVKAVFSGSVKTLYEFEKDGIRYLAAGCHGYNSEDRNWSSSQYYLVRYSGAKFSFRAVRVNSAAGACAP